MRRRAVADGRETAVTAEMAALKDALDGQREHVLGILEGLTEQDLRRRRGRARHGRAADGGAGDAGHLDAARELIDGTTWLGGSPYGD